MEHNAGLNKDWKRRVLFSLRQYFGVRRIGTVSHWTTSKTAAIREKIIAGDYVAASSMMQDLLQLADDGNKVKMQYLLSQLTDYIAINECISIINREIQKYLLSDVDL